MMIFSTWPLLTAPLQPPVNLQAMTTLLSMPQSASKEPTTYMGQKNETQDPLVTPGFTI